MIRMMLFADDGKAPNPVSTFRVAIPALLALLVTLGMDLKWDMIRGAIQYQWVGSWIARDLQDRHLRET